MTIHLRELNSDSFETVLESKDTTEFQMNERGGELTKDDLERVYGGFETWSGALFGDLAVGTNYLINNGSNSTVSGLGRASFGGALTGGLLGFASSSGMF